MDTPSSWLNLPLSQRLVLALSAGAAAALPFWAAGEFLAALLSVPPEGGGLHIEEPAAWIQFVSLGIHALILSAALILLALKPPRGALGWIAIAAGGGLLGLALQVGWSSQQLQIALEAPFDYPAALESSWSYFGQVFEVFGEVRGSILLLNTALAGSLLLVWGWALHAGHEGWRLSATVFVPSFTWAWILESVNASLFGEGLSVGLRPALQALTYTLGLLIVTRLVRRNWLSAGDPNPEATELPPSGLQEREVFLAAS